MAENPATWDTFPTCVKMMTNSGGLLLSGELRCLCVCVCVLDDPTCPTGGDTSLSGLVSELGLALAEGELQAGLEQRRWTYRETGREVGYI